MADNLDKEKNEKFNALLEEEIESYYNRPSPPIGQKYKRTPFDALIEAGKFTVPQLQNEFLKIINNKSTLPRSQRSAIMMLFAFVMKKSGINTVEKT